MATRYPTTRERQAIQQHADAGDESAKNYLKLLDVCTSVLESSNGITLARGLVGEHNDTYGEAIDDALSDIMPIAYELATMGWASLKFYVPSEILIEQDMVEAIHEEALGEEEEPEG
jgi:hypothetical protein